MCGWSALGDVLVLSRSRKFCARLPAAMMMDGKVPKCSDDGGVVRGLLSFKDIFLYFFSLE